MCRATLGPMSFGRTSVPPAPGSDGQIRFRLTEACHAFVYEDTGVREKLFFLLKETIP